jgi:hypothetical protein
MTILVSVASAAAIALVSTSPASEPGAHGDLPTTWAGHQITIGRREVPFQGEVETRTDTYVLATLRDRGRGLVLEQRACRVRFTPVGGVKVTMKAGSLPKSEMHLVPGEDGGLRGRSLVAWGREDVDEDGHAGMTVTVDAPVCSGDLYVANRSFTEATVSISDGMLKGEADVHVVQSILGADGACLSVVAEGTDERLSGEFAFVPVDDDASCAGLFASGWPVDATLAR